MQHIGDTKAGRLVGIDKMGNKYFEDPVSLRQPHRRSACNEARS